MKEYFQNKQNKIPLWILGNAFDFMLGRTHKHTLIFSIDKHLVYRAKNDILVVSGNIC